MRWGGKHIRKDKLLLSLFGCAAGFGSSSLVFVIALAFLLWLAKAVEQGLFEEIVFIGQLPEHFLFASGERQSVVFDDVDRLDFFGKGHTSRPFSPIVFCSEATREGISSIEAVETAEARAAAVEIRGRSVVLLFCVHRFSLLCFVYCEIVVSIPSYCSIGESRYRR